MQKLQQPLLMAKSNNWRGLCGCEPKRIIYCKMLKKRDTLKASVCVVVREMCAVVYRVLNAIFLKSLYYKTSETKTCCDLL